MKGLVLSLCLLLAAGVWAQAPPPKEAPAEKKPVIVPASKPLRAEQAKDYIGRLATVCGTVVGGRYAEKSNGQPTFLNFDKPYPRQVFTVVIWGDVRARFDAPEVKLLDKRVCVRGMIRDGRGSPQVEVRVPEELRVEPAGVR